MSQASLPFDGAEAIQHLPPHRERQTVDRAVHPQLGPGWAIYDNGPARFVADSGVEVECAYLGMGGASAGPPPRSWLVLNTEPGERIELDTTDQLRGERHERAVSKLLGPGWMVACRGQIERRWLYRFEADRGGGAIELVVNLMYVGTPDDRRPRKRPENKWMTFETDNAGSFVWRRA